MAQVHVGGGGNTKSPSARSRNWCFTLNNYVEEDIKALQTIPGKYIFQEEEGETTHTKHLQGTLMLKNAKTFSAIKKLLGRLLSQPPHIEICRDIDASIKYCSKAETRKGEIYANFEIRGEAPKVGGKEKKVIKKISVEELVKKDLEKDVEYHERCLHDMLGFEKDCEICRRIKRLMKVKL